jgi:putative transposase
MNQHCPGQNVHHLEWCTKYRFNMLKREEFYKACEASLKSAAQRHGIALLEIGVMSDHVHVIAELRADMSPARAAMLLKGASSYDLFRAAPNFRKRLWGGHFWGRSYFHRSAGDADLETVRSYVREENDPRQRTLTSY